IIKPTAHISTSVPNFIVPKSNSGDRCYLVTMSCDINPDGEPKKFTKPKENQPTENNIHIEMEKQSYN
ncbi:unnamed protein product, partial [Rotaria sp. Silwood1]